VIPAKNKKICVKLIMKSEKLKEVEARQSAIDKLNRL
jgi:hypothetical protein